MTPTGGRRCSPPPEIVAGAQRDLRAMREKLTQLVAIVQELMGRPGFTEIDAVVDVWLTLFQQNRAKAHLLAAIAVVELAKSGRSRST